jgi:hypothetical protein
MTQQEPDPSPPPTPAVLNYHKPEPPRKRWRYVLAAFGGFVVILIVGGVGTFASMSFNNGIPLYITGGIIVAAAIVLATVMKRSGWLIGLLLGAIVLGLLIGACGLIYPIQL